MRALVLCSVLLLLAGCGDSDGPVAAAPGPMAAPADKPGDAAPAGDRVFEMEPITSQGALLNQLTVMYNELLPVPPDEIACPPGVSFAQGSSFTCQVTADGVAFTADVQFIEDGIFRTQPRSVMSIPSIAQQIAQGIRQQTSVVANVRCQSTRIRISVPGEVFFCTASSPGQQAARIRVTVQDTNGNVNWEVL